MYKDLSLKEKADLFKVMVSNGVTDINEIENIYNKYKDGGYTKESENNESFPTNKNTSNSEESETLEKILEQVPKGTKEYKTIERVYNIYKKSGKYSKNLAKFIANTKPIKDLAYSIMAKNEENSSSGTYRNYEDIIEGIEEVKNRVKYRDKIDNNLSSLYIYGNDLNQYTERPDLRYAGVEYDNYLRKQGRNPDDIKTYEGTIWDEFALETVASLPDIIKEELPTYINSPKNKTYYYEKDGSLDGVYGDDVGNYASRLSMATGKPAFINSDLWDFGPTYYDNYINAPKWQAEALDLVGTPFILKEEIPVQFEDISTWDPVSTAQLQIARDFGILPNITVTPNLASVNTGTTLIESPKEKGKATSIINEHNFGGHINKYDDGGNKTTINYGNYIYNPNIKGWTLDGKVLGGGVKVASGDELVHLNTDGTITNLKDPLYTDIVRRLREEENSKLNPNGGYDPIKNVWYPHKSVEGGEKTVAYGIKLHKNDKANPVKKKYVELVESQGYLTDQQAEEALIDLALAYSTKAKEAYDKKNGAGAWDKLSSKSQSILTDFQYNPGLTTFPSLMTAFNSGNIPRIYKEYKRYTGKKPLGRNKGIKEDIDSIASGMYTLKK